MEVTCLSSVDGLDHVVNSAIRGYKVDVLRPADTATASKFSKNDDLRHIIFTAETHNFPTGEFQMFHNIAALLY